MLMLASATQKEVESVSDNIEQLSKDVSKLSQIGSDLIDNAVAFGIDIIIFLTKTASIFQLHL